MADSLNSVGSVAQFLFDSYPGISDGVSGNLVIIADIARQHVSNFTGTTIGSTDISDQFQPAIVDFARADTIDLINADGGTNLKLAELSMSQELTSDQYRKMAEFKLNALGKDYKFARSLS